MYINQGCSQGFQRGGGPVSKSVQIMPEMSTNVQRYLDS